MKRRRTNNFTEGDDLVSRRNGRSLHHQIDDRLETMQAYGRSKHKDKQAETVAKLPRGSITGQWIYSGQSMDAYRKAGHSFVNWIRTQKDRIRTDLGHTPRTLEEVRPYAPEWIQSQIDRGFSAYTVCARVSALSKIYGDDMSDCPRPSVGTQTISRSRKAVARDYGFSETKHADLVAACRCVGFRRHEAALCRPEHLMAISDGGYGVWIKGKGGRERIAPLVGSREEIRRAVAWIQGSTGHNPIPSHMDVHACRAEYAARVYHRHAQDPKDLKGRVIDYTSMTGKTKDGEHIYKSALLHGRGMQKGRIFDRYALIKASQALGHNRESVLVKHYSHCI